MILICCFSVSFYLFSSSITDYPANQERNYWNQPIVTHLEFIDGGSGNDTIVATVTNNAHQDVSVTRGYLVQSYWTDNGFIYRNHEQPAELFGDLRISPNMTKDIHLSLPTGTLIAGKTYTIELNTTQPHPSSINYFGSKNTFDTISNSQPYTFYHMYHTDTSGMVEEGAITGLTAAYCDANYADSMLVEVQNTGDFPMTIAGGFVNGMAAINATDSSIHITGIERCVIEKNSTGSVTLNFPAGTLYYTRQNPFNVKLVTADGILIEGADPYFEFLGEKKIQQPSVVDENAEIATVQFFQKYGMYDFVTAAVHNFGSNPINISSCMLNGKATTILSSNTIVEVGSTQTITLQTNTVTTGENSQLVLITSQNNAFIKTLKT
jgi:hypothetical protein